MIVRKLIEKAFTFKSTIKEKENVYIPKIKSTYTPPPADYNEISNHIHKQLRIDYEQAKGN